MKRNKIKQYIIFHIILFRHPVIVYLRTALLHFGGLLHYVGAEAPRDHFNLTHNARQVYMDSQYINM